MLVQCMACGREYIMVLPTCLVTHIDGITETIPMPEKSYCAVTGIKAEYQLVTVDTHNEDNWREER